MIIYISKESKNVCVPPTHASIFRPLSSLGLHKLLCYSAGSILSILIYNACKLSCSCSVLQEHHLQRAISAQQAFGHTGELVIPTPEVYTIGDELFDELYPPNYKLSRQLIHMQRKFVPNLQFPDVRLVVI